MGQNRRALIFAAIGLGLILVVFVVPKVLFGGGGGGGGSKTLPTLPRTAGSVPRATTTTLAPGQQPIETFEEFATKNPFQPLVSESTGGATPGGTPGATPGTAGTTATTLAPSPGGVTTPTSAPTNEPARQPQRVTLLDVFLSGTQRVANVRVNDTVYEKLKPGDAFAVNYKVVSLDDQCGTFLFGDSSFRLCKGQEVLK